MTLKEITTRIEEDLNIPHRRARIYTDVFKDKYKGHKEAISDFKAGYTDEGMIRFTYIINGKENYIVV